MASAEPPKEPAAQPHDIISTHTVTPTMFGLFRPSQPLFGGLLWYAPPRFLPIDTPPTLQAAR
ncbi:MAG: hypothetical protein INR71_06820 [Terriglobus roseus]|nr:hypothetical protein [Terriglobus roseus]